MSGSVQMDIDAFGPTVARNVIVVAIAAVIGLLALQMFGAARTASVPVAAQPAAPNDVAEAAHCSQFVELARAKYGTEWRRRLDPRDTTCAQQVQQAWERDWSPRAAPPDPVPPPTVTATVVRQAKVTAPDAKPPARDAEAHSLVAGAVVNRTITRLGSAEAAVQESTHAFNTSGRHYSRDRSDGAGDNLDDGTRDSGEQAYDESGSAQSDYGANDDQADSTRALNDEQMTDPGAPERDDEMRGPIGADDDADENDDGTSDAP